MATAAPSLRPSGPRLLTVVAARHLTPHMIRVTFGGEALEGFPEGREGGNCKLLLPEPDEAFEAFAARLEAGERPATRTYTVRAFRKDALEMDIDFVDHGDAGPASAWARRAAPGAFLGFKGASMPKVAHFEADWYLLAADLSGLPVVAAALEAMPRDAKGVAVFEAPSLADRQDLDAPQGIKIHWLEHPDAKTVSTAQEAFIRNLDWPAGRVQACIAGESNAIKGLRQLILVEKGIPKIDGYVSGYWKIGLVEDEHQSIKRAEAEAGA